MLISTEDNLDNAWSNVVHELHRGVFDKKHPFRFVTLATIADGQPSMRYVVLRAIDEPLDFVVYSDARTLKVSSISANQNVSLLFYHPKKRAQIRVAGIATLHQQDDFAKSHWQNVQGEGKRAYTSIESPGGEIADPEVAHEWQNDFDDKYFTVITIQPKSIEALQLNNTKHLRALFNWNGSEWSKQWIVP